MYLEADPKLYLLYCLYLGNCVVSIQNLSVISDLNYFEISKDEIRCILFSPFVQTDRQFSKMTKLPLEPETECGRRPSVVESAYCHSGGAWPTCFDGERAHGLVVVPEEGRRQSMTSVRPSDSQILQFSRAAVSDVNTCSITRTTR